MANHAIGTNAKAISGRSSLSSIVITAKFSEPVTGNKTASRKELKALKYSRYARKRINGRRKPAPNKM